MRIAPLPLALLLLSLTLHPACGGGDSETEPSAESSSEDEAGDGAAEADAESDGDEEADENDEDDEDEEDEERTDPRTLVEVAPVERADVSDWLISSSTVESEAQADLFPETTGLVTAIRAEEGDAVGKGQTLAVIENPTLDATLARAEAELERAERTFEETERLFQEGAVSRKDLEDAHLALVTARASADEARRTQAFTRIVSPIQGTVAIRDIRYGETAVASQRAFQVVDLDRLRVVVQLPERDLVQVHEDQHALLVPTYASEVRVPGRIERVSPVVDPNTGTFRVTVVPTVEDPQLRPGQFVSVRIELDVHEDTLTVPRRAVLYEQGVPYVFRVEEAPPDEPEESGESGKSEEGEDEAVADADEEQPSFFARLFGGGEEDEEEEEPPLPGPRREAVQVTITTGFTGPEKVEVVEGLSEGDQVVTLGHETLRDGARVRLPGDPTLEDVQDQVAESPESDDAEAAEPGTGEDEG